MRGPWARSPRSQPDLLAAVPAPLRRSVLAPRVLRSLTGESRRARLLTRCGFSTAAVPFCGYRALLLGVPGAPLCPRRERPPDRAPKLPGRAPRAVTCAGGANRRGRDVSARQLRGCGAGSGRSGMARRRRAA